MSQGFRQILKDTLGMDLNSYKETFLKRRMEIAIRRLGYSSLEDLMMAAKKDTSILEKIFSILTIPVSSFFRNPEVFLFIEENIIPEMKSRFKNARVLSAGCSTGEEAYSIGCLLLENGLDKWNDITVHGVDLSSENIEHARRGLYPATRKREIPPRFYRYFVEKGTSISPSSALKEIVHFTTSNVLSIGGQDRYNLVFLRNVLIFLNRNYQEKIMSHLLNIASDGAFLVLGKVESPPREFLKNFKIISPRYRIYEIIKGH